MPIEEQENQSLHVSSDPPGHIRSHLLRPQHSRIDYARRKSATDLSSSIVSCFESSTDDNDLEEESPKMSSTSWFQRRFTLFSLDQPINQKHQMTKDHFSFSDEKSYADLLKQKRPSLIAQVVEVE